MPRNKFNIPCDTKDTLNRASLWLLDEGYQKVQFKNGKFHLRLQHDIYNSLVENPGYTSYFKEGEWGCLVVIEIRYTNDMLFFEAYSPVTIFGFIRKEYKLIENPSKLKKGLRAGFYSISKLKNHLNK